MPGSATTRPSRILTASVAGLLVIGVPSVAHAATSPVAPARYSIVELSTPSGGYSRANAINNAGVVVGTVDVSPTGTQPVRWSATGVRTDLPGPAIRPIRPTAGHPTWTARWLRRAATGCR